jgi:hypothetical protein
LKPAGTWSVVVLLLEMRLPLPIERVLKRLAVLLKSTPNGL